MEYTLKRLLTYSNVARKEDFMLPEKVHDCLYELFVITNEDFPLPNVSFVNIFNEVSYMLTCIFADQSSPEHIKEYLNDSIIVDSLLLDSDDDLYYVQRYIFCYVWIILKTHKNLPKHVKFFLVGLENKLEQENCTYYTRFKSFLSKHQIQHELEFPVNPRFDFNIIGCTTNEWKEVTCDFDKEIVAGIIHRFNHIPSRELIIDEIRKALSVANNTPDSSPKVSMLTHNAKADDAFLDMLLQETKKEEAKKIELKREIEKSKDERIADLMEQVKDLKEDKREALREKESAERERDKYRKKLQELTTRLNHKYIPAQLKSEEAMLILNELVKKDIISPLGHNNGVEFVIQCYRWDDTGALFGYFVDRMNFQLELADSGGRTNWKPFKCMFSNYEEKEKRARDTVSFYKQHPKAKKPEKAEIIDEVIENVEKVLVEKKN